MVGDGGTDHPALPEEDSRMTRIQNLCKQLLWDSGGQDLVEYAVLTSLISLVAVVAVGALGTSIGLVFQSVANQLEQ